MASAVAKRKGKRKEEKNKSLKDVEQAMNKINFGDNVSGENTSEGMVDTYFSYMAKMISNLPEGVRKQRLMMQLEEEKIAATESMVAFKKQLVARVGGVQKMRFDEGDQSPLVGEDAEHLQDQLDHLGFDHTPINPFSLWMKVIFTGNYEGMMSILEGKSDMEMMMLLGMRESLMNVPALLHVVCGAKVVHSNQPAMLAEKRKMEGVMEVKYDYMKILEKLIELGADLKVKDVAGCTFLHHCFSGCGNAMTTAMAEVVLKAGLDPNIQDRFGHTPLFRCMSTSVLTDLELLLKYGADPGIKDYQHGVSCLTLAHAFPAANRLFGKYTRKEAVKERGKAKEEMGGSLKKCVQCGKDNSARWETYFEKYLEADDNKRLFQVQRLLRRPLLQR